MKRIYTLGAMTILSAALALCYGCGSGSTITRTVIYTPANFTTIDGPGGGATTINGINNNGATIGFTTNNGANANFLRSAGGAFTALNVGDAAAGMANAVNSGNTIVGVANNSAFVLTNGTQKTLTPPGSTTSIAFGINDGGAIVGQYVAGAVTPGFLNINGAFTTINPTANAMVTNVQGVNNKGQAIGFYSTDGMHQHGFLYNVNAKQITLLPDPSTARTASGGLFLTQFLGINDNGEAVGYYQTNNGSQFGFLYNLNTQTYTFLDDPQAAPVNGVQITQITGVTNSGEICGFFIDAQGVQHGFTATR
jgi:uncharacterized membrane protein